MTKSRVVAFSELTVTCTCGSTYHFTLNTGVTEFDYEDWLYDHFHGDEDGVNSLTVEA